MPGLPTGTVTFLFTDVEGSTQSWEQHPEAMRRALARHDTLLRAVIQAHQGYIFKTMGDQFCAAFAHAADAVSAALAAQQRLRALPDHQDRPSGGAPLRGGAPGGAPAVDFGAELPLRVRIALHSGEEEARGGDYFGLTLNRIARLLAIAHGDQVVLSQSTVDLVRDDLPPGASLRYLGSHRLRDLQQPEQVYQLLHADLPSDFPPLRSQSALPHNLPQPVNSFVGRERDLEEVQRLLATTRLLTFTGSGGTGKTRLSLQVAVDLLFADWDGAWLVEFASLNDPSLVPQAVATVLGVRGEPGQPLTQTLVEQLKTKSLLLVLDNCEHLLAACAALADALLRGCPGLRILATSREALKIPGEQIYPVPPLSTPDPRNLPPTLERLSEIAAVRLFMDRATAAVPSFGLSQRNAPVVAEVCHRLEGIPLAIELAAARLKALSIEQIARRLDDRFRLLTGGSRTALPRHQTLRALLDWSYDLLSEAEQCLFRRLSVFAGGFTLAAAEAVCSDCGWRTADCGLETDLSQIRNPQSAIRNEDVLDLLAQLVDKSLVLVEELEAEPRYRLLETIRQYAWEKLRESGEEAVLRGYHRDWLLAFAEEALPQLSGPEQPTWLQRLIKEYDNLRVALGGALEREHPPLDADRLARWGQVVEQLVPVYRHTGWREGTRAVLEDYIALCEASGYARGLAHGYTLMGEFLYLNPTPLEGYTTQAMCERALALCETHGLDDQIIYPQSMLAYQLVASGADLPRAEALARACLPQAEVQQDAVVLQRAHTLLMWVAAHKGDWNALRASFQASLPYEGPGRVSLHLMLRDLEEHCHRQGAHAMFRELCHDMAGGYARAGLEAPFQRWYLQAASPRPAPGDPWLAEEFDQERWHASLQWQDPTGRSRLDWASRPGWLGLYPAPGANLWPQQDLNAPRLVATVNGDFVAQTRVELGRDTQVLAGLLVWRDEQHFARLEVQLRATRWERAVVHLEACVAGQYHVVGRGQCERQAMWLRVERVGDEVRGLCSADGEQWLTCGSVHFPPGATEQVGMAVVWHGPGAYAWFDSFTLWGKAALRQEQS